jgi:hypothetical protein
MSRVNPALPDNKAVRSKIVRNRSVNVNNVSAKNRAVAGNKAAEASRADDNPWLSRIDERREATPAALYVVNWKQIEVPAGGCSFT